MTRKQVIDKVANDRVRFVSKLRNDPANQSAAARVPFEINRSGNISGAMYLRPTMWTSGLLGPDFDEPKFPLQLRITHYFVAQRFATARYDLDHGLHSNLDSAGKLSFCNDSLEVCL
jgi:hypothetical protein